MEQTKSEWSALREYFINRINKPIKSPGFVIYFFIVILVVGALGIHCAWAFNDFPDTKIGYVISNMNCYFLTLISTSSLTILLMDHDSLPKTIRIISFGVIVISVIIFIISTINESFLWASSGILLSLITWWIANAENKDIIEKPYDVNIRENSNNLSENW